MGTTGTLAFHQSTGSGEPSWRLYEELFEAGVVYLALDGVSVELRTREQGGADVVVRRPVGTATSRARMPACRRTFGKGCATPASRKGHV